MDGEQKDFMQHKKIRTGPSPLWLHLNGGAAMMAVASDGENMFAASQEILVKAMDGVKAYHDSDIQPFIRDIKIIADVNGSQFITGTKWNDKNIVLIVPSLINGWGILDIEKDHSFIAFLKGQGLTPVILNWAEPKDENISLDDYITHHCAPLIQKLLNDGYTIKGIIGYCMGGTMIAALYSAFQKLMTQINKVVLIAPPWDFSYQSVDQMVRIQSLAVQTYAMDNIAPNDFVQSLFWAVDPLQVLKKFRKFPDVQNPDRFVRVEDWLNGGRAVSKSVIQTCLFDWYRDNKVMNGQWSINDKIVTDKNLPRETFVVVANNDNLVPLESSKPLMADRQVIKVNTGHIGLMASDKSMEGAWKPIVDFIKSDKISKRKKS